MYLFTLVQYSSPKASNFFALYFKMILDRIIWPTVDSDDEEYGDYSLEDTYRMTGFFRLFIETGKLNFLLFTSEAIQCISVKILLGWNY